MDGKKDADVEGGDAERVGDMVVEMDAKIELDTESEMDAEAGE